jgi:hypothetical protein
MLTNTHAIAWSGEKVQQGQHNLRTKISHDKVPINFHYGLNLT